MTLLAIIVVCSANLPYEFENALRFPRATPYGMIMTDARCGHIHVLHNDSLITLVSSPGCGRYYTVSPDCSRIGYKMMFENGLQAPAYIDLRTGECTVLHEPSLYAGQVSFSADGGIAYTIGDTWYVRYGDRVERYILGFYANVADISPDGQRVVFNDYEDQLWILELNTGVQCRITRGSGYGYCLPKWSGNGQYILYQRLDGYLFVYNVQDQVAYELGTGYNPQWSPDGQRVIFYRPEIALHEAVDSDLFMKDYDGTNEVRLTSSPGRYEVDPCFCTHDRVVFSVLDKHAIMTGTITDNRITDIHEVMRWESGSDVQDYPVRGPAARDSLDVPYLHQVYDTPEWFNGHWACAPSTAMMAIAYYVKLPVWNCWCSSPYGHTSDFGRYICEHYQYREVDYTWQAQDPNGAWATGGYGYMWSGANRPYTHMAPYLENHDIVSWRDDSPTFEETVAQVNAGYPYGMCVGLTTAGHLVLAVGQVSTWHTLICNDPYGNKNTSGYPSYDGKYARYDWPGYNNGYENLNYVYWCVGAQGTWEPESDTIVDDLQFASGFYLHTESPSSMEYWRDALTGYSAHMWWTYTTAAANFDTCYAVWTPVLPVDGNYEVFAYIPDDHATATAARYRIYTAYDSLVTVILDQSLYGHEWVSLGTYPLLASTAYAYLGDATGTQSQYIGFDAVRWSYQGPGVKEHVSQPNANGFIQCSSPVLDRISMIIHYAYPGMVLFRLYSITGQCVKEQRLRITKPGEQRIHVDVADCASGVYSARVTIGRAEYTRTLVIINR